MNRKCWLWLLMLLPLQVVARDPFMPPAAACGTAGPLWMYHGLVSNGENPIGLVKGPEGKWRRVQVGSLLPEGLSILSVSREAVTAQAQDSCQMRPLRWDYQEKHNERKQNITVTVAADSVRSGGKSQRVHRGGRSAGRAGTAGAGGK